MITLRRWIWPVPRWQPLGVLRHLVNSCNNTNMVITSVNCSRSLFTQSNPCFDFLMDFCHRIHGIISYHFHWDVITFSKMRTTNPIHHERDNREKPLLRKEASDCHEIKVIMLLRKDLGFIYIKTIFKSKGCYFHHFIQRLVLRMSAPTNYHYCPTKFSLIFFLGRG